MCYCSNFSIKGPRVSLFGECALNAFVVFMCGWVNSKFSEKLWVWKMLDVHQFDGFKKYDLSYLC